MWSRLTTRAPLRRPRAATRANGRRSDASFRHQDPHFPHTLIRGPWAAPCSQHQWRWHGGHGHSHGGLDDDDDDDDDKGKGDAQARAAADRITWLGVYTNVALSGAKGIAGITFHSSGLLADAVHSISDLVSDGITLLALRYCARPPDTQQPYGYGKYETVGALSVALLLVGGSLGIIHHSFDSLLALLEPSAAASLEMRLEALALDPEVADAVRAVLPSLPDHVHHHHQHQHPMVLHPAALGIAAVSVGAKEALYRATIRVGRRLNSSVLVANAWHHRSDAVTSVVAMGGIGLSLAGLPMFDPLAGMLVGGIILKMGGEIGWEALRDLCDAQLPQATLARLHGAVEDVVRESAGEIAGVRGLRGRKIGRRLHVDLTLVLRESGPDGDGGGGGPTFQRACEWKQRVKATIQARVPRVQDILVELATPSQDPSTVLECPTTTAGRDAPTTHPEHEAQGHGHGHSHGKL